MMSVGEVLSLYTKNKMGSEKSEVVSALIRFKALSDNTKEK
jgi:hypothetical protein